MTLVLTIFAYAAQLCALAFLPALLFFCLRLGARKKTALLAALLCAVVIFTGAAWLAFHPIRSCPAELEPYMTEQRWQDILSATPPVYSPRLPFFPVRITVELATEDRLYWSVNWFPYGTSRTGLTPDGYDLVHGLQ